MRVGSYIGLLLCFPQVSSVSFYLSEVSLFHTQAVLASGEGLPVKDTQEGVECIWVEAGACGIC